MAIKITKKITSYSVATPDDKAAAPAPVPAAAAPAAAPKAAEIIHMHERVERPETLIGATYKIKSPLFEHALYVTINDIVLNPGTEHELRRPFELFINSKNMEAYAWTLALTRMISAVFRRGGDVSFVVDELKAVFDPRGGQWMSGHYVPSLLAAIAVKDALAASGGSGAYLPRGIVEAAFGAVREVDAGAVATAAIAAAAKRGVPAGSDAIAKAVRAARLAALRRFRRGRA